MLKISGRTKLVLSTLSKLILAMLIGCTLLLAILFVSYNPTYEVKLNGESLGYVSNKSLIQKRIDNFIQNGDAENVGYVILKDKPEYEFALVKKDVEINDDEVTSKIIDTCEVYYRVYGINVGNEEEFVVETIEEAQQISDKINEEQKNYTEKKKIEISEKFVRAYDLIDDVEVAVNDIVDEIDLNDATPSHAQTIKMRKFFEEGKLTTEAIQAIMSEEKPNQREKIVLRGDRVRQLIPKNIPISQTEDFVCKALEHYNKFLRSRADRDSR